MSTPIIELLKAVSDPAADVGGMRFNTITTSRSRDPLFYEGKNGACRAVASVFDVGAYETVLSTLDHSPSRYPY